jgi:hypothetical protein
MPERPDLRQVSGDIRAALEGVERDGLVELLVQVFREYVVEGPPPAVLHQTDRLPDLEGLSFAQLVAALKLRLPHAELELLEVEGEEVRVRTPGGPVALRAAAVAADREPPATPREPAPVARPPSAVSREPAAGSREPSTGDERRASVDEAAARGRGDLAGGQRGAATPPPPRRGLSVRGAGEPPAAPPPAAPVPPAAPPAPAPPAAAKPGDAAPDGDDAAVRFSLLELD